MSDIFNFRIRNFDWSLFIAITLIAIVSLLSLASVNSVFFKRQLVWYGLAFLIIFFASQINWRWLIGQLWFRQGLYWFVVLLLLISNLQSGTVRGTRAWLSIGSFQFEPAELMKLALIFILAGFFSRRHISAWQGKNIFISLLYTLLPAILIALHPDLGSAVVIVSIWLGFLLMSGVHYRRLIIGCILTLLVIILLWSFFLKSYQKERIVSFLAPEKDPLGINYNVIQSKIAIGSAGLLGKGFKQGTQTQLHFLPETQSDFLFAAFVEEWGIIGGFFLILTFLFIIFRIVRIGWRARNNEFKFIILGSGLVFAVHFFINIGSNLGLVPVAGITLPFFSYGGSSLLTNAVLISIIEHIQLESSY